jgi:hypothetical protein
MGSFNNQLSTACCKRPMRKRLAHQPIDQMRPFSRLRRYSQSFYLKSGYWKPYRGLVNRWHNRKWFQQVWPSQPGQRHHPRRVHQGHFPQQPHYTLANSSYCSQPSWWLLVASWCFADLLGYHYMLGQIAGMLQFVVSKVSG